METLSKRYLQEDSTENRNAKRTRADENSENLIQKLQQDSREIQELQYCINSKLNDIQTLLLENRDFIKKNLESDYNKVNQLEPHINEFVFAHRGPLASATTKRQDDGGSSTDAIGIYNFEHSVA